jgi:glycosyltransferase involved in cell wall biosynthesis
MLLPYWAAKIKGAEVNYFIYGNVAKEGTVSKFTKISSGLIKYMAKHADYICVESKSVINEWPQIQYRNIRTLHLYTESIEINSFEKRKNVFGMICRLTEGKHVLECIQAMAKVHEKYPEWNLEIVGSGRQQEECAHLINQLDASRYIKLLGWIEHNKIIEASERWKILLFPTDTEGVPNSLLEMMGCGIPALVSPVGGITDIVKDNMNGFWLDDTSASSIASNMEKAICISKVQSHYEEMSLKAYLEMKTRFTLEAAQAKALCELKYME